MASALASLTANYTDSEGEEDRGSEDEAVEGEEIHPTLAERLGKMGREGSPSGTPGSSTSGKSVGTPTSTSNPLKSSLVRSSNSVGGTPSKKAKLVSYNDPDGGLSDDEREPVPMELESDDDDKENDASVEKENGGSLAEEEDDVKERSHIMEELWEGGVKLPPEPAGHCSKELQEKFEDLQRKKVELGYDYNALITNKKAFRNPSIYDKLIQFCNIDELGTNFPPELYDGHLFGKESYYEELGKVQKIEMDRREKALEAKKKMGDNRLKDTQLVQQQHRKSKWDQQVPGAMRGAPVSHLSSSKVIPAFGSLKKK